MNDVYFACSACRVYVDAGYRHACQALEDAGVVTRTDPVDSRAVLDAGEYWEPDAEWLVQLLPSVRKFLNDHGEHVVRFGDAEELALPYYRVDPNWVEWLMEAGFVLEEGPRYYVERLDLTTWEEVVAHVERARSRPRWWDEEFASNAARQKFTALVLARRTD